MNAAIPHEQSFVPVITGGSLGTYTLAREFHELGGLRSAIIPTSINRHLARTSLAEMFPAGPMLDPAIVLEKLAEVAGKVGGGSRPLLFLPAFDHHVRLIADYREDLERLGFLLPRLSAAQLATAAVKERFYALCADLDLPYPPSHRFSCAEATDAASTTGFIRDAVAAVAEDPHLSYPLIVKADDGGTWAKVSFPGRRKVFLAPGPERLERILRSSVTAGYRGGLILQKYLGGPDNLLRILTQFRNRTGTVSLSGIGEVIVEDHAPGMEGNARAILATRQDEIAEQGARILEALDWHGFAMFDLKVDPASGRTYFLEMNPRLGQHHFYLTLAGANPAKWFVDEFLGEGAVEKEVVTNAPAFSTTIPGPLAHRFATGEQRRAIAAARGAGRAGNPWKYAPDRRLAHRLYLLYRAYASIGEVTHAA